MAVPSPEKPEPTMAIPMWGGRGRSAGATQGWSAGFAGPGWDARSRSTEADFVMLGTLKEMHKRGALFWRGPPPGLSLAGRVRREVRDGPMGSSERPLAPPSPPGGRVPCGRGCRTIAALLGARANVELVVEDGRPARRKKVKPRILERLLLLEDPMEFGGLRPSRSAGCGS